jgi:hypothetical protein
MSALDRVENKMSILESAVKEKMERLAELEAREEKRKAYKKEWYKEKMAEITPEELATIRSRERERKVKERESLTDEQREAVRKADRERKSKANLTEEQLEARRAYNREYKRKQREAKTNAPISEIGDALKELEKGKAVLVETPKIKSKPKIILKSK